ncbi:MAG: hypothetical protein HRT66_02840, partial [Flavobacteriaceae bacterium]|nr:hypothetical protein [Flavobacteriaceae bacterium]
TIYMVSQNKDLELIFGADVDSLMFAEAKWQLDGTSYQLPFLLDLNKTRNSSLKIIDSDNDGKGFEVNIQVYPRSNQTHPNPKKSK